MLDLHYPPPDTFPIGLFLLIFLKYNNNFRFYSMFHRIRIRYVEPYIAIISNIQKRNIAF